MIQNRLVRNVSANTLQLTVNQLFGLAIFFALSKGLDKHIFGQINWSLAVLLTMSGILGFGIDQVMVKKIAAGYNRQSVFAVYAVHVIISGSLSFGLFLLLYLLFPSFFLQQSFLLIIGIGKLAIFFSTPFKQLAAGLEKFSALFAMSVVSNIIRGGVLLVLLLLHQMSVTNVLIVFISGDLAELLVSAIIAKPMLQTTSRIRWNKKKHFLLLKESIPQTGVVIFTAIMSRFDWIMIGWLVSSSKLAEYSFAWKIFEVSTFPLLIIAPIMIPLFTRTLKDRRDISGMSFLLEWQITLSSFIAMLLNVCWAPLIDVATDGKYGAVNTGTVFLLSLAMPLLYFNNYSWTISFAQGQLKRIFIIMGVSFTVNIAGCTILIPIYKNEGAAFAYFLTALTQLLLYSRKSTFFQPGNKSYRLLLWPFTAIFSGFIAVKYFTSMAAGIAVATTAYITVVLVSKKVRLKDWKTLQALYQ